jgi:hypothetical protein
MRMEQKIDRPYKPKTTTKFEFFGPHGAFLTILGLPIVVIALCVACDANGCPPSWIWTMDGIFSKLNSLNWFDKSAMSVYVGWILFQFFLAIFAPGRTVNGRPLPDGTILSYRLNAVSSLVASYGLLGVLYLKLGLEPFLWIAEHYFQLATSSIIFATMLSVFLYIYSFRSSDVVLAEGGNSGYPHYDFWMGRELNPRIFNNTLDLKFVCELRPGLIGWSILNLALMARQFVDLGYVTNSMILVNLGQGYYVFDAIWNENAILTTMDITTDGFGFEKLI